MVRWLGGFPLAGPSGVVGSLEFGIAMYRSALGEFQDRETAQRYIEQLKAWPLEQRWRAVADLREFALAMASAEISRKHPDWDEAQVRVELARRLWEGYGAGRPAVSGIDPGA